MTSPRDILNELKWKKNFDIDLAEVWFVHRGASDDTKIVSGEEIVKLEKSFMVTNTASIPYHRIFKITYDGKIFFKR